MIIEQTQAGRGGKVGAAVVCAVLALTATACSKIVVGDMNAPVRDGEAPLQVTVTEATLRRVMLETDAGPMQFESPVLAVKVKFENVGAAPHFYQPRHTTDKALQIQDPLLFVDPGEGKEPAINIASVRLSGGLLPDQQEKGANIEPGKAVQDVFLFTAPAEEKANFILTVPPSIHGGAKMLHIRVPYTRNELPPEEPAKKGEAVELGDLKITVTAAEAAWIDLKDRSKGKGYSAEPLFKVSYKLETTGEGELRCSPNHTHSGTSVLSPSLGETGGRATYPRVRFGGNREVVGQAAGELAVKKGAAVEDFAVFERPPQGVKGVTFVFPAALCGQSGIARVALPYKWEDPERPKDLPGN